MIKTKEHSTDLRDIINLYHTDKCYGVIGKELRQLFTSERMWLENFIDLVASKNS